MSEENAERQTSNAQCPISDREIARRRSLYLAAAEVQLAAALLRTNQLTERQQFKLLWNLGWGPLRELEEFREVP